MNAFPRNRVHHVDELISSGEEVTQLVKQANSNSVSFYITPNSQTIERRKETVTV